MSLPAEFNGKPRVTLHFAQSIDGRIATRCGTARWISGPPATRFAHELRAAASAVVIGSGTALADDPQLTVRHVEGPQPLRIVLDGRGRVPDSARLMAEGTATTILVTSGPCRPSPAPHVETWRLPAGPEGVGIDLPSLLDRLGARGVSSILVEGGSGVITSFLRAQLVDRLVITVAPMIMGAGIQAVGDLLVDRLEQAHRFRVTRVESLGDDLIVDMVAKRPLA